MGMEQCVLHNQHETEQYLVLSPLVLALRFREIQFAEELYIYTLCFAYFLMLYKQMYLANQLMEYHHLLRIEFYTFSPDIGRIARN